MTNLYRKAGKLIHSKIGGPITHRYMNAEIGNEAALVRSFISGYICSNFRCSAVFRIRISFNADCDPACGFCKAKSMWFRADPDQKHSLNSLHLNSHLMTY
jgi:hypothetical protein